jgi:hypothetical protein
MFMFKKIRGNTLDLILKDVSLLDIQQDIKDGSFT